MLISFRCATILLGARPTARTPPPSALDPVVVEVIDSPMTYGASVRVHRDASSGQVDWPPDTEGRVYLQEAKCWSGDADLVAGDLLCGYASKAANSNLDVCWDAFGHQSLIWTCTQLCNALRSSPNRELRCGTRTDTQTIARALNGMSKSQFRAGASALYKAGTIVKPSDHSLELVADPVWIEIPAVTFHDAAKGGTAWGRTDSSQATDGATVPPETAAGEAGDEVGNDAVGEHVEADLAEEAIRAMKVRRLDMGFGHGVWTRGLDMGIEATGWLHCAPGPCIDHRPPPSRHAHPHRGTGD